MRVFRAYYIIKYLKISVQLREHEMHGKVTSIIILTCFVVAGCVSILLAEEKEKPYNAPDVSFKKYLWKTSPSETAPLGLIRPDENDNGSTLKDLRGSVVLVLFGRSGGKPGEKALKALDKLATERKDKKVRAFYVNYMQKTIAAPCKVSKNVTVYPDPDYKIGLAFKPRCLPCLYVIDKFGSVRSVTRDIDAGAGELVDSLLGEEKAGNSFKRSDKPLFKPGEYVPPVMLYKYKGEKWRNTSMYYNMPDAGYHLVFIGGTYCQYTASELDNLRKIEDKFVKNQLSYIIINVEYGMPLERIKRYYARKGFDYYLTTKQPGSDNAGIDSMVEKYSLTATPYMFLTDHNGVLLYKDLNNPQDGLQKAYKRLGLKVDKSIEKEAEKKGGT